MSNEPLESISNRPDTRVDRKKQSLEQRLTFLVGIVGLVFVLGFIGYQLYQMFTG